MGPRTLIRTIIPVVLATLALAVPGTAGAATFGKTTVGSVNLTSGFSGDVKRCTLYSLTSAADVSKLTLYTGGLPGYGPNQVLRGVIYATSGGVPTTRVAVSNELNVLASNAVAWRDLTLPSVVRLAPGTYCLGTISGATAGTASFSYDSVPNSWFKNSDVYSDGATNPFGTTYETGDLQMSIYATYTPIAAQRCDKTQTAGESFPSFVARLGVNEHGCMIAGTYDLTSYDPSGRFAAFKSGQVLKAKANADGRRQSVTVKGELLLNVAGVQLEDFTVLGTNTHSAIDMRAHNLALRYMNVDSSPRNHDTQGIIVGGPELQIQNVVIENSKIHHQGSDNFFDHGIYCQNTASGRFQGNWFYDNAAYGLHMYTNCDGIDFANDVVADNGLGIVFANDTSGTTVRNGVVAFNTNTARERGIRTSALVGTGNVVRDFAYWQVDNYLGGLTVTNFDNEDPLFVNRAARDYRLQAGSPSREELGSYADAMPGPRT
jgi:hypothetical protein